MRITREFILKFTHETIERLIRSRRDVLAVYLSGSFLGDDYGIGGSGDVDLFFVHTELPIAAREVIPLTDEIHLDIAHLAQQIFKDTRRLRIDPWLGSALNNCKILHDPQHFMDFVQASVRGQYDRADFVFQRARPLADHSREIWFHLQGDLREPGPMSVRDYLSAVGMATNAIACLSGAPLPVRRLVLEFPARVEELDRQGLFPALLGLLGAPNLDQDSLNIWIPAWRSSYQNLSDIDASGDFHPARLHYYLDAFESMAASDRPFNLLWPLLRTWTSIAALLPSDSEDRAGWQQAMVQLGLFGPAFEERVRALDAYLDLVDETLEIWARQHGVWGTT